MRRRNELALLPKLPLLISESADEFDALRDAFEREIKPRGVIEQMYVHDISSIVWEILRLRRCKVVIINSACGSALEGLLAQLLRRPGQYKHGCQRHTSSRTTRSSSPRQCRNGSQLSVPRPPTSSEAAPGRTATSRASTLA